MDDKKRIRKVVSEKKKTYSVEELLSMSYAIMNNLEEDVYFKNSEVVLLYHSLPDEVFTHDFIEKWKEKKTILLPVVKGEKLIVRKYDGTRLLGKGCFGIEEPQGNEYTEYSSIDIVVVPGVSFDKNCNRLGRGKGYYDRFLKKLNAFKIGICFDFQIYDNLPVDEFDIKMDKILTEKKMYQ